MCSGRLDIAALRSFLTIPASRRRYQLHLDRRCKVPPWLAIFRQGWACSSVAYDGPGKRTEGRRAFEWGTTMLVIPLPHKAVSY